MSHDEKLLAPHQCAHIPERDDFRSKDSGEAERYRLTREAVLEHLIEEPTVARLFSSWDQTTGLLKLAETVAQATEDQKPITYRQFIKGVRSLPQVLKTEPARAAVSWGLPYYFVSNGLVAEYILQRAGVAHGFDFRTWTELQKDALKIELNIPGNESDATLERVFEGL